MEEDTVLQEGKTVHDIKKRMNLFMQTGASRLSRDATAYILEQFVEIEMVLAIEIEKRAKAEGI